MVEMTGTRFGAIVAAYGADPRRWPEGERAAAEAFARGDAEAAALLDREWDFDRLLLAHAAPEPSPVLTATVLAGRPVPLFRRVRIWWAALALGLAGAGGALAGSAATAALVGVTTVGDHEAGTAFGDLGETEAGL